MTENHPLLKILNEFDIQEVDKYPVIQNSYEEILFQLFIDKYPEADRELFINTIMETYKISNNTKIKFILHNVDLEQLEHKVLAESGDPIKITLNYFRNYYPDLVLTDLCDIWSWINNKYKIFLIYGGKRKYKIFTKLFNKMNISFMNYKVDNNEIYCFILPNYI